MNLGEAKKKALALMLEYSNDGTLVPDSENGDYLAGMNLFANDAQIEISNIVAIEAVKQLDNLALPSDFKAFRSLLLNGKPYYDFRIQNRRIAPLKDITGIFELFYEKNPITITPSTDNSYEFEIDEHTHHLIPYYLGGMALAEEKENISSKLLNIYYNMLSNLKDYKNQFPSTIQSVDGW